jgi:hypothetical protein
MGKRSNFERKPRDFYPTPYKAVKPLLSHLPPVFTFAEPCAGDGRLIDHLAKHGGKVRYAYDLEPQSEFIQKANALSQTYSECDYIITNPPWNRKVLHPMIEHFANLKPTWLLFDADWMHTKQSMPYLPLIKKIVSIGRVKWIEDSKSVGKDNCCWYLFHNTNSAEPIEFWGRMEGV